jgi:hypothetical protein
MPSSPASKAASSIRPDRVTARAAGASLLAVAVLAGCGSGGPLTIRGTFKVHDAANRGTGCKFAGTAYADIRAGTQVVVTAPDGTVIGSGALGRPSPSAGATICLFRFTVQADAGKSRYGIEVASRGVVWFSPSAAPTAGLVLPAGS